MTKPGRRRSFNFLAIAEYAVAVGSVAAALAASRCLDVYAVGAPVSLLLLYDQARRDGDGALDLPSIVEAHGGRLWASPNSPRGSIFQFTVPAASSETRDESAG